MKIPFQPFPDGVKPLTLEQFRYRLEHHDGFGPLMQRHYEEALSLPSGPDTEEMQSEARAALKTLKHYQGKLLSIRTLEKCKAELLQATPADWDEAFRRRLLAFVAESMDHILDVLEPERTELMTLALELRELMRGSKRKS